MGKTNLRIMGASEEVKKLVELLPAISNERNVSREYPNRGSSDVRVYAYCVIDETNPFTQAMEKYAEYKDQIGAMMIIGATPEGQIMITHAATSSKAFISLLAYILSENFLLSISDQMDAYEHNAKGASEVKQNA